jgi:hypothetical protein
MKLQCFFWNAGTDCWTSHRRMWNCSNVAGLWLPPPGRHLSRKMHTPLPPRLGILYFWSFVSNTKPLMQHFSTGAMPSEPPPPLGGGSKVGSVTWAARSVNQTPDRTRRDSYSTIQFRPAWVAEGDWWLLTVTSTLYSALFCSRPSTLFLCLFSDKVYTGRTCNRKQWLTELLWRYIYIYNRLIMHPTTAERKYTLLLKFYH